MLQRPKDATAELQPPESRTLEYLVIPSARRRRRGTDAPPLWAVAAPTSYGWLDDRSWYNHPFLRHVDAVFACSATATLREVHIGQAAPHALAEYLQVDETAVESLRTDGKVLGAGWMSEGDDLASFEVYVEDHARIRRALRHAARQGGGLLMQVAERPEAWVMPGSQAISVQISLLPFAPKPETSTRAHERLRRELQALALHLAEGTNAELPPLLEPAHWQRSEVHEAAREIVLKLGAAAYRRGWTVGRLKNRIRDALEFLLQARAGGLGIPPTGDRAGSDSLSLNDTVLVDATLLNELITRGADPVRDPRTSLAYTVSLPSAVAGRLYGDELAHDRLREVPDLVTGYLAMRWLRYGPLSAALARALVVKETVLFTDDALRRPSGVLDGSLGGFGAESLAYRLSNRARRPMMLAFVRFAQHGVARLVSTAALLAGLLFFDVPNALWIAAAWLLFAGRIRILLFGEPDPSTLVQLFDLSKQMRETLSALAGPTVPVAVFRHALLTASEKGVAWDAATWRLLADAERRREVVWHSSPGHLED